MKRALNIFVCIAFACCFTALADTIYFKDGSTLDGSTKEINQNSVALVVGKARMVFQYSEIASIEENDKEGDAELIRRNPFAVRHDDIMTKSTGLNRAQREEVRNIILGPLISDDARMREAARKTLVKRGEEIAVFSFLENALPFLPDKQAVEVLDVLVELDPDKAVPVLQTASENGLPKNRAKALEILGDVKQDDPEKAEANFQILVRGMVDLEDEVKVASAHALAKSGDKRATALLLEGLDSSDMRVQNSSLDALQKIWSNPQLETSEQWTAHWNSNSGNVKNALSSKDMLPLFNPETDGGEPSYFLRVLD